MRQCAHEVLLPADATEIRSGIRAPLTVLEVLVEARTDVGEGLLAAEVLAAGLLDIEPALDVARGCREVDGHTADRVDDVAEAGEVDLQVVPDRHVEVLLDRLDDALRSGIEGRVD